NAGDFRRRQTRLLTAETVDPGQHLALQRQGSNSRPRVVGVAAGVMRAGSWCIAIRYMVRFALAVANPITRQCLTFLVRLATSACGDIHVPQPKRSSTVCAPVLRRTDGAAADARGVVRGGSEQGIAGQVDLDA